MIFLIQYDRAKGVIVSIDRFEDASREAAETKRLSTELDLNRRNIAHEVVLLEADDERNLRRTHRRYFEDISQLSRPAANPAR